MPEFAGADLERRVAALVQTHRPQLAEFVRQAVDQELQALVAAELASLNGANGTRQERSPSPAGETSRQCRSCDRDLAPSAFETGRRVCRECRQRQHRERERRTETAGLADRLLGSATAAGPSASSDLGDLDGERPLDLRVARGG
jgi:hypothetical protein